MNTDFKFIPVFSLIIKKKNKILLAHKELKTSESDIYTLIGAKIPKELSITQAIIDEAYKAIGIKIKHNDLKFVHVLFNRKESGYILIQFFFCVEQWDGDPINKDPKIKGIDWWPLKELPSAMFPSTVQILTNNKIYFSETY